MQFWGEESKDQGVHSIISSLPLLESDSAQNRSGKTAPTAVGESGTALQSWGLIHSPALSTRGLCLGVWHGHTLFPSIACSCLKSTV